MPSHILDDSQYNQYAILFERYFPPWTTGHRCRSSKWSIIPIRLDRPGQQRLPFGIHISLINKHYQCTDISVTPKNGTPPYTLTVGLYFSYAIDHYKMFLGRAGVASTIQPHF